MQVASPFKSLKYRIRHKIAHLPVMGKALRYAKWAIKLPVYAHHTYREQHDIRSETRQDRYTSNQFHSDSFTAILQEMRALQANVEAIREGADRNFEAATARLEKSARLCFDNLAMGTTDEIARLREQHADSFSHLLELYRSVTPWMELIAQTQNGHANWLESIAKTQNGLSAWMSVMVRKVEMLAMDVRDRVPPLPMLRDLPEPQILDPVAYRRKIDSMQPNVRVNLGCGEKPIEGYINVDGRAMRDVDVVADIRRLPFEPGSLGEIASSHLVEHFRQSTFEGVILPYWKELLNPERGCLRIICPNFGAMLDRLQNGGTSFEDLLKVTFGGQDYEGDDHFAMYNPETLSKLLKRNGFSHVEIVVPDRINGLCSEMEILARRE